MDNITTDPETVSLLHHEKQPSTKPRNSLGPRPALQSTSTCRLILLNCMSCGWACVWLALLIILVPKQVSDLPGVGDKKKGKALGLVLLFAGIISIFQPPLVGWLSDNCRTRFGRRRVFMVFGVVGMSISMCYLPQCKSLATIICCFMTIQFFSNFASTTFLALIPDVIPKKQLGLASGTFAAMCAVGQIIGAAAGTLVSTVGLQWVYIGLAVFFMTMTAISVTTVTEDPNAGDYDNLTGPEEIKDKKPSTKCNDTLVLMFGSLLDNSDFRWVWFTRFLFNCGISIVQGFLQYFVADRIPMEGWSDTSLVSLMFVPIVIGAVIFSSLCGYLSDKWGGQRRIFVYWAGAIQITGAIGMMFVTSFPLGLIIGFFFGAGFGTFTSIDLAIAIDVLDPKKLGRDLGIWHVSAVIPQLIMSPLCGTVLDYVREGWGVAAGYGTLFLIAALLMLAGTLLVAKIKNIK